MWNLSNTINSEFSKNAKSSAALKMGTRRGQVISWTLLVKNNPNIELKMSNCFARICPPFDELSEVVFWVPKLMLA